MQIRVTCFTAPSSKGKYRSEEVKREFKFFGTRDEALVHCTEHAQACHEVQR